MPTILTEPHSSRVHKRSSLKPPPTTTSSASPFASLARGKPAQAIRSVARKIEEENDGHHPRAVANVRDHEPDGTETSWFPMMPVDGGVRDAICHSQSTMFGDIGSRPGMNSTRIAHTLNFQRNLPPLVSTAHVRALITASTRTEREIATLLASAQICKVSVSGRGNEISGLGEFLILFQRLEDRVRESPLPSSLAGSKSLAINPILPIGRM